ncbi:hypothetical protein FKW77_003408 [Venturia effusa]|uniref:Phosphatidylethanolamine-binding protein n=1 Tax=Venturia effusa TaxID=50376 RepID=A0A517L125_9PEZI|nr:hypothetical protein FKW77_003408 [Venturia effusa]
MAFLRKAALAASLLSNHNVLAQTPMDFMPGTLVKLGVQFNSVNIDPAGSAVGSLDQVATEPVVTIPSAMLVGPNGEMVPGRRFMVFMIDIDVVQENVATTVLHWFQPNLIMEASAAQQPAPAPVPSAAPPVAPLGSPSPPTLAGLPLPAIPFTALAAKDVRSAAALGLPPTVRLFKAPKQDSITDQTLPASPLGLAAYFGPGPPPGAAHRYVQVLFAQPRNFSIPPCYQNILTNPNNPNQSRKARVGFDIMGFLKATNTNPRPIAGNYFRAQNPTPGNLARNAASTRLVDAQCAGATPMAAPPLRFRRFSA